ncbi:MAG: segregation/condensation protein A [Halobacteriales archaeon]
MIEDVLQPNGGGAGEEHPVERIDADEEPIEVLVQLAEDGEIDPWNIDIVQVTDKFLERLDAGDLRASARALFYASVLLRMKSDAFLTPDEPEEPDPFADAWDDRREDPAIAAPDGPDPIGALDRELERRLDRKRVRGGTPETLDELVRELREQERDSWWKQHRSYDTSGSPEGFWRGTQTLDYHRDDAGRMAEEPTVDDVTGTAHGEDMEATIEDVDAVLRTHFEAGREEVLFAEVDDAGGSRVETYLAVLFLSHRGELRLEQDDLFGDLWLQQPDVPAPEDEDGVAASEA